MSTSSLQAGAHEDMTTTFDFEHGGAGKPYNDARSTVVELPAGFSGNNTAVPTCSPAQLLGEAGMDSYLPACPISSQVGLITLHISGQGRATQLEETQPVYNMEVTSFGTTAELGFKVVGVTTQILVIDVRPHDEGLTVTAPNISKIGEVRDVSVTIWGLPAAHEHDEQRGETCGYEAEIPAVCHNEFGAPQPANIQVKPFLANPTSCGQFEARMKANSWEDPEQFSEATSTVGPIGECERVPFAPSISAEPSTEAAESPTGLDVTIDVPQTWENPFSIATANLKDATVTLPEGFTANPSLAAGLGACTPAQFQAETAESLPGEGCPPESKIGSIEIETPLLAEKIDGAVFIATPYDNVPSFGDPEHPGGALLALYVVAKSPARGIVVKVAGKIEPNPVTGQLVTTFLNNPQQPFSRFSLKFRPGSTAPLATPPACGSYATVAALTPWSAPEEPRVIASRAFEVSHGVGGGACPSGGVPPLHPQVLAGTQNNAAGSYSPFYLRIVRQDGEQELTRFSTTMPAGLTGNLSGVPFCSEAGIEAAKHVTGAEEEERPSCPAASEVGHTLVGAGVGPVLAENPGRVYLAGPYHGAPLSLVSITSAKVGPFDLGTVVIRFALDINHTTAQVEVSANGSDPIPHIIRGIVVHVRDIRVYIDRPDFIINPTNCGRLQISNTIDGAGADPANPADQIPVSVTSPFEAADCASLKFQPEFKVSTSAKTSKANGASLDAKVTYPSTAPGTEADVGLVKVELPKQLPSRLTTLQKACAQAQFKANPAGCPAASVVGHAVVSTPIVPVPLVGPAYFVSNGNEAFPNLIVVLQGYGLTIDLVGDTFISKAGVTSTTFKAVPDEPFHSFELSLPEGPYSALAANANLCALRKTVTVKRRATRRVHGHEETVTVTVRKVEPAKLTMPNEFVGQNGAVVHQSTPIDVLGCPKSRKAMKASGKHHRGKGKQT